MEILGISYGYQIGGKAFLGSVPTSIVELCFEDQELQKGDRCTLFVNVLYYDCFEEITVADVASFSEMVNSDREDDNGLPGGSVIESYGDEIGPGYHEMIKEDIAGSIFAKEIHAARYALDLFVQGKYDMIGQLFGKEVDQESIPEVEYDKVNDD